MGRKKLKPGWIKIREHNREIWVDPSDVCYFRAARCYSWLFLKTGKSHLTCQSLKNFEIQLRRKHFYRCHRSYLVNMLEVKSVDIRGRMMHQKLYQIPFSRDKAAELLSEWSVRIIDKK